MSLTLAERKSGYYRQVSVAWRNSKSWHHGKGHNKGTQF